MRFEPIHVEAYSGYTLNEHPRSFELRGQHYDITGVLDRWYEGGRTASDPVMYYFKVRVRGGAEFVIRYNSLFDAWALVVRGHLCRYCPGGFDPCC